MSKDRRKEYDLDDRLIDFAVRISSDSRAQQGERPTSLLGVPCSLFDIRNKCYLGTWTSDACPPILLILPQAGLWPVNPVQLSMRSTQNSEEPGRSC